MPESPPTLAVPRIITCALRLAPALWAIVLTAYLVAAVAGDPLPPHHVTLVVLLTLVAGTLTALILWSTYVTHAVLVRLDRHLDRIRSGLIQQGVALAEVTGELPRVVIPPQSPGLDPEVLDLGRSIARRLPRG
jgi:hypothetical protein